MLNAEFGMLNPELFRQRKWPANEFWIEDRGGEK
jgi:hypothetical protein